MRPDQQPSLTVIVPTIGRRTLSNTIVSVPEGWQILVVCDGPDASKKARRVKQSRAQLIDVAFTGDVGHAPRNFGMALASTEWLAFMDDDDIFSPKAGSIVEAALDRRVPHIFQMQYANGGRLWSEPNVRVGNVGTPMFVVPNDPDKLGRWPGYRCGDHDFIRDTCALYDESPRFVEQVIALVRPNGEPD